MLNIISEFIYKNIQMILPFGKEKRRSFLFKHLANIS